MKTENTYTTESLPGQVIIRVRPAAMTWNEVLDDLEMHAGDTVITSEGDVDQSLTDERIEAVVGSTVSQVLARQSTTRNEMIEMIETQGDYIHGGDVENTADDWIENGFSVESAGAWIGVGFWDATTASRVRDGLGGTLHCSPEQIKEAAERLVEENGEEAYTDGCPIYAACNGDIKPRVLIDAAYGETRVQAGEGDDHDTGTLDHIRSDGMAVVRWDSGVTTPTPLDVLRVV